MNEDRRAEILAAYELHASIFDEVARRRARAAGVQRVTALGPARVPAEPVPGGAKTAQPRLSRRMHEVLTLIADGHTNPEIGRHLDIGCETVKSYVARLVAALDARNRAHAVAVGYRSGLLGSDSPRPLAAALEDQ